MKHILGSIDVKSENVLARVQMCTWKLCQAVSVYMYIYMYHMYRNKYVLHTWVYVYVKFDVCMHTYICVMCRFTNDLGLGVPAAVVASDLAVRRPLPEDIAWIRRHRIMM